ncbi:MAG: galactose mutarotase [Bacteroides sp.]|nr:galactose mutarotase [Bacteroides sp.]MCM1412829.1 galactose mutarotase [Bacteroides sp.]MCM1471498.1 galactose mutarotase [Bacteroides sp.]
MKTNQKKVNSPKGKITLVTLTNTSGASVVLSSLGAGIVSVVVPDSKGDLEDVALGYANAADYFYDGPCAGKVPGRYANRIAGGRLRVDGKDYQLSINNGPNALHGGPEGFQNRIWDVAVADDGEVVFTYTAADGEENYPGELRAEARYRWDNDCRLQLTLSATTNAPTVVNLTNHCYWNLEGHNSGSVLDHTLWIGASRYLPTDETLIPTGEMAPVVDTPMDFTTKKTIGRDIKADFPALVYGKGYDNCWVVDNYTKDRLQHVATLEAPRSGRLLEVLTTQPAAQVYTGNWLAGSPINKDGRSYNDYDGVAIECQAMPDSPHHADFPSTQLYPGQLYSQTIVFQFKTL